MIKIANAADLHAERERLAEFLLSMKELAEGGREAGVDIFALSGDLFDGAMMNTRLLSQVVGAVKRLADIAPVVLVYGTPSHDIDGCLEVVEQIDSVYGVTILRPGVKYFLSGVDQTVYSSNNGAIAGARLLIFGIPEPTKKWLLAGQPAMGKEAADEAASRAMQALFLGLAAMRREHADLPCLVVYHGDIRGAKMQNGRMVEGGVTRDALLSIGADYYGCGHIHEPQEVTERIWYVGSAFPQNWGEEHLAGWNLVHLSDVPGDLPARTRMSFSHPQRKKISQEAYKDTGVGDVKGKLVWLEITCKRDDVSAVDVEASYHQLVEQGALPGSKVTLNILPTETVRAGDIAEKKAARDKVSIWAENSGRTVSDRILEKADAIEEEMHEAGTVGSGGAIRLQRLVLRGAIGIWKNQKKDEIVLDFEQFSGGVMALVGENGSGKTTLIENCHPWPTMLTREGKLQDHFRLRDSFRDLYFVDDETGTEYRAQILINGAVQSGGCEYYLYKDGEPVEGINGRKEPYEAEVNRLFGSLSLYLKSAFTSQRPSKFSPDFSDATKGQRKDLMAELSGIDYLDAYADHAKMKADGFQKDLDAAAAKREALAGMMERKGELEEALKASGLKLSALTEEAAKEERRERSLEKEYELLREKVEEQRTLNRTISDLSSQALTLEKEMRDIEHETGNLKQILIGKGQAEDSVKKYDELRSLFDVLNEDRAAWQKDRAVILRKYQEEKDRVAKAERELLNKKNEAERKKADNRAKINQYAQKIEHLREKLAHTVTCPKCNHSFPLVENEGAIKEEMERYEKAAEAIEELSYGLDEIGSALALVKYPDPPEDVQYPKETELATVKDEMSWIDIDAARVVLRDCETAAVRIEEGAKLHRAKHEQHADLMIRCGEARKKIDAIVIEKHETTRKLLEDSRALRVKAGAAIAELTATIKHLAAELEKIEELGAQIERLAEEIRALTDEISEYRLLQDAFGQNGIQALELDALCPGIAVVANGLLSAAYGSRYQVEFATTRTGGSGSKKKQIEDFLINVLDSETGMNQEISTLSGGEAVWIKRAIYDAFAVIRARNTGIRFLTVFQDEADGALDPAARERYFRMLEAAHATAGRYQTVIITHSTEVQEMIGQKIYVTELPARITTEAKT